VPAAASKLTARLAEAERLNAAIVRTVMAPAADRRRAQHRQCLAGWGVKEKDARLLAEAIRQCPT
jgi:hypothetical protein